jgi:hypothetical protein
MLQWKCNKIEVSEKQCWAKTRVAGWLPFLVIRFHCVGVGISTVLPCINQLKSIILYLTTCMPNFDWCKIQLTLDVLERWCCISWGLSILLWCSTELNWECMVLPQVLDNRLSSAVTVFAYIHLLWCMIMHRCVCFHCSKSWWFHGSLVIGGT